MSKQSEQPEPRGPLMAKSAIDAVAPLHSVRARERLQRLIVALEARPSRDNRNLAQLARTVASGRHLSAPGQAVT